LHICTRHNVYFAAHNKRYVSSAWLFYSRKEEEMLVTIINALRSWHRYNQSLRELSQLGDRELADIGITRSDIARVAWEDAQHS
jgi:uncharacterized protein YjiS (DUF1127 family)